MDEQTEAEHDWYRREAMTAVRPMRVEKDTDRYPDRGNLLIIQTSGRNSLAIAFNDNELAELRRILNVRADQLEAEGR